MATVILISEAQWARPIFGMHQISQPRQEPEKSQSFCGKPPHVEHAHLWFEAHRLVLSYMMSCQRQTDCGAVAAEASAELQPNQATRTGNRRLRMGNRKHLLSLNEARWGLMASVTSTGRCYWPQQQKFKCSSAHYLLSLSNSWRRQWVHVTEQI